MENFCHCNIANGDDYVENDPYKQFQQLFNCMAGNDQNIDAEELKHVLNALYLRKVCI